MNTDKTTLDLNNEWNYPIFWLWESRMARQEYQRQLYRVDKALLGHPSRNLYQEKLTSNLKKLDLEEQQAIQKAGCNVVNEGRSYILREAVQNRANQMASGVDTYEYEVEDRYGIIRPDTQDLLAATCRHDYVVNHLEELSATFSRDLTSYGLAAVYVRYDQKHERNIVERVNPKNTWWDTKYSATGRERFRGFSTMISWSALKKMIEHEGAEINTELEVPDKSIFNKNDKPDAHIKIGKKKIRTLNDLDIYILDMNKLAESPSLQAPTNEYWEYDHDLHSCYNLSWYHTFATDPKAKTDSGYNGDDVELTVLYDLTRKIEFKIINRRFVISANKRAFKRKIAFTIHNPITNEMKVRIDDFYLDCPLKFQFEDWENRDKVQFPTSSVMAYLDAFDELCMWRAKRDHVSDILSILRIETNGADATSLKKTLNLMGVILDDVQGDINSINFAYDYTPIDSQIQYLEETIIRGLNAYTQFSAMQAMGDRATAAESGMAIGAVAQGLSTHQNAIMALYAAIARQCIANRVAYSANTEFPVSNLGDYSAVTIQEMALDAIVTVIPKLAKRVQERTTAANALTALGTLKDMLTPEGMAALMEQALFNNFPRKMAQTFIKKQSASPQEIALAQQQAQNQAMMLQQNQQAYEANPLQYEAQNVIDQMAPDEVDQVIAGLNQPEETQPTENPLNNLEGVTAEQGADLGNPNALV